MKEIDIRELRFGISNRKSSDTEDKQVQSIETQERENKATAQQYSLKVVDDCIYNETKSAFLPGRERFAEMVADIKAGRINGLIVVHPNRLARNPVDAGTLIELMDRRKLLAIKTPSKVYFSTGTDKMMLGLEFLMSKKDSDDKSDFVKGGLKTKALKGLPSGVASIGFLNDRFGEVGNKKWVVDRERFAIIEMILKRFLQGDISASRLHKWAITELKLTTPKHKRIGGALIVRSRIFEILKDPIYAGFFVRDDVRYELDPILPRMITEDEHMRILQFLGGRHMPKTKKYLAAYTGFMRGAEGNFIGQDPKPQLICDCKKKFAYLHREHCPKCGIRITEMEHPKYLPYVYYYNVKRKKSGKKARHISETKVNTYMQDYVLKNLTFSTELADWSRKYLHELKDKDVQEKKSIVERQGKVKSDHEAKKARYREMLADGHITPEEYRTDIEKMEKTVPVTSTEGLQAEKWLERAIEITDLTQELAGIIENGTVEAKRRIMSRLGSNLIWNEKKLTVINTKSVQVLINGLNRAKRKNPKFEPAKCEADKDKTQVFSSVCPILLRG